MKVLVIASLGAPTGKGNVMASTAAGTQVFVPANLAEGLSAGECVIAVEKVITQKSVTNEETGEVTYEDLAVPQVRLTATFVGTKADCAEAIAEEDVDAAMKVVENVDKQADAIAAIRAKFADIKKASKAGAETNA